MGIAANETIMRELHNRLGDILTENEMIQTVDAVRDILMNYDVTPNATDDSGKDFMLDVFLDALKVEGRSPNTIERYRYIIGKFLKFAATNTKNVNVYHVRSYLSAEKDRGLCDNTVNGIRMVLSSFFGWLHRDGLIQKNPMSNIGTIKCQKKIKEVYSEIDIELLKRGCKNIRDRSIVYFLKATGCRIGEVVGLNRDNIDFANLECVVLGKGNKQRTVYMDPVTGMVLKAYLNSRKDDNPALFIGKRGNRLSPHGVRYMLTVLGKNTGVSHVYPHKFRRTQITELVNRGMAIEQVKELAGHTKIDTTMGYVVLDVNNIKNAYRRYA